MKSSGLEKIIPDAIFLFFLVKKTRRKCASSEPLIKLLLFVVGKLWPKNVK